jgi:hypothetical protein
MNLLDTEKELFALYHKFPRERISFGLGTKKNMSICFAADKRPTGKGHTRVFSRFLCCLYYQYRGHE